MAFNCECHTPCKKNEELENRSVRHERTTVLGMELLKSVQQTLPLHTAFLSQFSLFISRIRVRSHYPFVKQCLPRNLEGMGCRENTLGGLALACLLGKSERLTG